jgi:hypothetical protein
MHVERPSAANAEKPGKVTRFLEWISPEDGLESMAGESTLLEGVEETPWATEVEVEHAVEAVTIPPPVRDLR